MAIVRSRRDNMKIGIVSDTHGDVKAWEKNIFKSLKEF